MTAQLALLTGSPLDPHPSADPRAGASLFVEPTGTAAPREMAEGADLDALFAGASPGALRARRDAVWSPDLAQRVRAILHATPLTDLLGRRFEGMGHYRFLELAICLMDAIVERMGLEDELDHEAARLVLAPLLSAMDKLAGVPVDAERHEDAVRRLLGALQNEDGGREPFDRPYLDATPETPGGLTERHVAFRLLSDYHVPGPGAGRIVFRLSNEAINLTLDALNADLADAQAAAEALVESQLHRGRFADALRSATAARVRSVRFTQALDEQLERTTRDVTAVDWSDAMPRQLEDARRHIELRLTTEENILDAATRRRDELPPGSENAARVAEIVALMYGCRQRHLELLQRLMRARTVFLEAQSRQAFTVASAVVRPDLAAQVLAPVLRAPARDAHRVTDHAFRVLHPPVAPRLFNLAELIDRQLRPKREPHPGGTPVRDRKPVPAGVDPAYFTPAVRAAARAAIQAIDAPTTLGALLESTPARAAAAELDSVSVGHYAALLLFKAFAPDDPREVGAAGHAGPTAADDADAHRDATLAAEPPLAVRVERRTGHEVRVGPWTGDDLLVTPLAADTPTPTG